MRPVRIMVPLFTEEGKAQVSWLRVRRPSQSAFGFGTEPTSPIRVLSKDPSCTQCLGGASSGGIYKHQPRYLQV